MPTKRRRRPQPFRAHLTPAVRAFLATGDLGDDPDALHVFELKRNDARQRALWQEVGEPFLADWISGHPGTRPEMWWRFDAPEQRRRLGGIGTDASEVLAYLPAYRRGVPIHWVDQWSVDYYQGRAVDIHGRPIGQEFAGHDFRGVAIDPNDPPMFESEAMYLDRLGLLGAEERAALDDDAFEPETVNPFLIDDIPRRGMQDR